MRDMKRARILLVDGDEVFRLRVQHILEQEEGMEIVGDFASAEEALKEDKVRNNLSVEKLCLFLFDCRVHFRKWKNRSSPKSAYHFSEP